MLAVALAVAACQAGFSISFTTLDDLVRRLRTAEATGRFNRQLQAFLRPAVLVVDEVGYLPLDRAEANMFFQLITRRYERGTLIVTSNKSFTEWGGVLGDDVLATAILDKLLHHCDVLAINGPSYRSSSDDNQQPARATDEPQEKAHNWNPHATSPELKGAIMVARNKDARTIFLHRNEAALARSVVQTGDPANPSKLEFMVREIQALNGEINALKRETRAVLGLVVSAATLVASMSDRGAKSWAVILLPFLLTGLAAYSFNLNADIASLAEQRDRLSDHVDRQLGARLEDGHYRERIFLTREVSNIRRGAAGTAATYVLAGAIVVAANIFGLREVWLQAQEFFWLDVAFSSLGFIALALAVRDLPASRAAVNERLDRVFPDDLRLNSPNATDGWWKRLKKNLWGRSSG